MSTTLFQSPPELDRLTVQELRVLARRRIKECGLGVPSACTTSAKQAALIAFIRGDDSALPTTELQPAGSIDGLIRLIVADELSKLDLPAPGSTLTVSYQAMPAVRIDGVVHEALSDVLRLLAWGEKNIMLVGPAGTGKTTLCAHVAKSIGVAFSFISLSSGIGEHHLFGRMLPTADGSWKHVLAEFARCYQLGGVFLLDEMDAADPNLLVSINAALANGHMANPINGEIVTRHKDCIIIAACNTYGRGADRQYVGRNQLDAATLDRFVMATVTVNYSPSIEKAVTNDNKEVIRFAEHVRSAIHNHKLRRICSTRAVERMARHIAGGCTMEDCKARFFADWSEDEKAKVSR